MKLKDNKKREIEKLRNELGDCDGASKSLIESLQIQKNKRGKHFKNIKNLLNIQPPSIPSGKSEKKMSEENPKQDSKVLPNTQQ